MSLLLGSVPEKNTLIVRADANTQMGVGHLMRCLALTQGWKARGGQVTFITNCKSDRLRQRLLDEGVQVVTLAQSYPDAADWQATLQVLAAHPAAWVVLDGYHLDSAYQRQIKRAGHRLMVIDDMAHLDHYYADIVLNQNINAEQLHYACEPYAQLLLGTRYALLRSEFSVWRGWQRKIPQIARKVLVTLGGGDSDNQTLMVIRALQQVDVEGIDAIVVVGASNPHFQELESAVRDSRFTIRLVRNAANMPELMTWADMAISAGGSTCWELAFLGLPTLILILAENQRGIAAGLAATGAAANLGLSSKVSAIQVADTLEKVIADSHLRQQMSQRGNDLVDGLGSDRVAELLEK